MSLSLLHQNFFQTDSLKVPAPVLLTLQKKFQTEVNTIVRLEELFACHPHINQE
jgi:hypothetical protein